MALYNRKPKSKRKDVLVKFRVSTQERKKLNEICDECGMVLSELLRFRVLGLTSTEIKAIASGHYVITIDGVRLGT